MLSSSGTGSSDAESTTARARNRRPNAAATSAAVSNIASPLSSRLLSSQEAADGGTFTRQRIADLNGSPARSSSLLSPTTASWAPYWSSLQDLTSSLFTGNGSGGSSVRSRSASGWSPSGRTAGGGRKPPPAWGPTPPGEASPSGLNSARPRIEDVAAGQVAEREAELKARKTASVLESHPGVNGGLDVRGRFKRRMSDENIRGSVVEHAQDVEDCLAYIHRVQPSDTYFGIILKYRCNDDTFRKANGLWSKDSVQIRKWVILPVEACEIKGRPCDDPSLLAQGVDALSIAPRSVPPLPPVSSLPTNCLENSDCVSAGLQGGNGLGTTTGAPTTSVVQTGAAAAAELPWTHVRWVRLDSCADPVEIVRLPRASLGYFPPRRKRSIRGSVSSVSTPRASLDVSTSIMSLPGRAVGDSPSRGSRRSSLLSNRVARGTSSLSSSPSAHYAGPGRASMSVDPRPEWLRGPGGVGSMSRSVRAPGPARDSLNKWTTKHLPGFNIETLPSMSVMGSETAHFGFGEETPGIVENSFEDGREAPVVNAESDLTLDKAAASIENWLRSAFTKRPSTPSAPGTPSTSFSGRIGRQLDESLGDLIELEDGPREDRDGVGGRNGGTGASREASTNQPPRRPNAATGWRTNSEGSIRGRCSVAKGKKID